MHNHHNFFVHTYANKKPNVSQQLSDPKKYESISRSPLGDVTGPRGTMTTHQPRRVAAQSAAETCDPGAVTTVQLAQMGASGGGGAGGGCGGYCAASPGSLVLRRNTRQWPLPCAGGWLEAGPRVPAAHHHVIQFAISALTVGRPRRQRCDSLEAVMGEPIVIPGKGIIFALRRI